MKTVLIILEGLFICFWLLMICILLIANGPVGGVVFYEQEVQDRSVKLGLITKEKIRKRSMITVIAEIKPITFASGQVSFTPFSSVSSCSGSLSGDSVWI